MYCSIMSNSVWFSSVDYVKAPVECTESMLYYICRYGFIRVEAKVWQQVLNVTFQQGEKSTLLYQFCTPGNQPYKLQPTPCSARARLWSCFFFRFSHLQCSHHKRLSNFLSQPFNSLISHQRREGHHWYYRSVQVP